MRRRIPQGGKVGCVLRKRVRSTSQRGRECPSWYAVSEQDRWTRVWAALGLEPRGGELADVLRGYAEPHRAYHTLEHLRECFEALDSVRTLADHPDEIEIALWYHDVIYEPRADDNEELSAAWAGRALTAADATPDVADRVASLILATKHGAPPVETDTQLLVDVDLSILGAAPQRFAEYEAQIRVEYAWVPMEDYRRARCTVLQSFLDRAHIYSTEVFRERLEPQARRNLQGTIERLRT